MQATQSPGSAPPPTQTKCKALSIAEILAADDCQPESVDVPEWGGTVYVLPMTGSQRDQWDQLGMRVNKGGSLAGMRAKLMGWSLCDESGNRLAPNNADVHRLGEKSSAAIERVAAVILRMSGITEDKEELEKN